MQRNANNWNELKALESLVREFSVDEHVWIIINFTIFEFSSVLRLSFAAAATQILEKIIVLIKWYP